ncbi:hypothetical protein RchiOBHm_Chr1g0318741 [Rosa chinensis]|uniref:Uncharacterized protein n=1 Tax=Rosa chinensis TaxID=74649 RepID=A0A2P6S878_ROSCH|nr:hypothetical protein RchiOBHm_Chr1g0318741 [Rosa chinensis]
MRKKKRQKKNRRLNRLEKARIGIEKKMKDKIGCLLTKKGGSYAKIRCLFKENLICV